MANRFLITGGGSVTWDASNTAIWSTTTGGGTGASVPGSGDAVIMDGASGGGTVTMGAGYNPTLQSITCGAFTGTFDCSANNNNVTLSLSGAAFSYSGSGTRTINMGSGTWTFTGVATNLIVGTTTTGLTFTGSSANLVFTATTASARATQIQSGASFASWTISANTSRGTFTLNANILAFTVGTLAVTGPNGWIMFPQGVTTTVTNGMNISGSSTAQTLLTSSTGAGIATISSANNHTFSWCAFNGLTFSGGGTGSATDSFDNGRNSGITITAPSGGGSQLPEAYCQLGV